MDAAARLLEIREPAQDQTSREPRSINNRALGADIREEPAEQPHVTPGRPRAPGRDEQVQGTGSLANSLTRSARPSFRSQQSATSRMHETSSFWLDDRSSPIEAALERGQRRRPASGSTSTASSLERGSNRTGRRSAPQLRRCCLPWASGRACGVDRSCRCHTPRGPSTEGPGDVPCGPFCGSCARTTASIRSPWRPGSCASSKRCNIQWQAHQTHMAVQPHGDKQVVPVQFGLSQNGRPSPRPWVHVLALRAHLC